MINVTGLVQNAVGVWPYGLAPGVAGGDFSIQSTYTCVDGPWNAMDVCISVYSAFEVGITQSVQIAAGF